MENRIQKIARREFLEQEVAVLKKMEEELDNLRQGCNHDVVVLASMENVYHMNAICLFCGEIFQEPQLLKKVGNIIQIFECRWNRYLSLEEKYNLGKELYFLQLQETPELGDKEIVEKVNEKLKKL